MIFKLLWLLKSCITSFTLANVNVSTNACVEVSVSVVIYELLGAQVTLELLFSKQILNQWINSIWWDVFFLTIWTVVVCLSIGDHTFIACQIVTFWALLGILDNIAADLAYEKVHELFFRHSLASLDNDAVVDLQFFGFRFFLYGVYYFDSISLLVSDYFCFGFLNFMRTDLILGSCRNLGCIWLILSWLIHF